MTQEIQLILENFADICQYRAEQARYKTHARVWLYVFDMLYQTLEDTEQVDLDDDLTIYKRLRDDLAEAVERRTQ